MENHILETLRHCYTNSPSLILIMDLQWQILWSNRTCANLSDLPQQLGIALNHTAQSVHRFCYEGEMHECRLLCNETDGYRIAEISPCTAQSDLQLRMDLEAVTTSVQTMTGACNLLYSELTKHGLYNQIPTLNLLIGSCYRIYRMAYLQKELDRLQSGNRRSMVFSVNAVLRSLREKCETILQPCLEIDTEISSEEVYLSGDMDEFQMAILSAITLCCTGSAHFQLLHIHLEQGNHLACLRFTAQETPAELSEELHRIEGSELGSFEGERAILSQFCKKHGGKWLLAEQAEEGCKSCSIYFCPYDGAIGTLTLQSPRDRQESKFFNKYEIMLSRIHYQNMFR